MNFNGNRYRSWWLVSSFAFLAMWLSVSMAPAFAQASSSLWIPAQRPEQCHAVDAQLPIIDVSKSMRNDDLFPRAIDQIQAYIDDAPACTYVILGRFGTTADVV